jgi:hypothetical protein
MRCQFKSDYKDWTEISSPQILILSSASPWTWSNCADLKSSLVLIVGFEILRHSHVLNIDLVEIPPSVVCVGDFEID